MEKATGAVWKDQATMSAVAKQKAAQEGQANTSSGYTPSLHHEGGGDTPPIHREGMDYYNISPLPRETPPQPDTRRAAMGLPAPNCHGPGVTRSLTDTADVQFGSGSISGSIQPIFELECDGNVDDDDVFEASYHDDDSDEQSREHVTMRTTQTSRPVDIPRNELSPYGSTRDSPPETRMFLTPPGRFVQRQRFTTGSLMCPSRVSISGQVPLGPDNVMVHEALAWTRGLVTPASQGMY